MSVTDSETASSSCWTISIITEHQSAVRPFSLTLQNVVIIFMYIQARIENKLIHNENELQFLFKCYMMLHYIISHNINVCIS